MKALVVRKFGLPDTLELDEYPIPQLGDDEVLVEVHAAGVNFPDLLVIDGTYQILPSLPFIPGKECAGMVKVIGPDVTVVKPGDRVMVQVEYGAYSEQVVAKATNCYSIPKTMSYIEAAAMGLSYLTAYFALIERAQLQEGEVVLITGAAGGVGLAAVQIAKTLNATVIAVVDSPEKAAMARKNGAAHVIYTTVSDLRGTFHTEVSDITQGHGADVVLDQVGGELFDACLARHNATVCVYHGQADSRWNPAERVYYKFIALPIRRQRKHGMDHARRF